MKKNLLTLGIAAAVGSLGFSGSVVAQAQATSLVISPTGMGHMLVVPYYTAQGGNATRLQIVNADKINGKLVKVRFRGASNADNVFDFTLLLGPADVWTAEVSQNPNNGFARMRTSDNTCTLPTQINQDFIGARLNPASSRSNETREGYIEIVTTANIPPTSTVFPAIKHTNGNTPAPCTNGASLPVALRPLLTEVGGAAAGLGNPTTGLLANWTIHNVNEATAWSGEATAIVAVDSAGLPGYGNIVASPQAIGVPSAVTTGTPITNLTADPLLASGAVAIQFYDLPDLSTPYISGWNAAQQAARLSTVLAKASLTNEYLTDDVSQAQTDWVFTLPTRRYSVALNHATGLPVFTVLSPPYFNATNTTVAGVGGEREVCATGIGRQFWSQSEQSSPVVLPTTPTHLCGGVSVWSINGGDATAPPVVSANVTRQNIELGHQDGWGEISTPGIYRYPVILGSYGLPVMGMAFTKTPGMYAGSSIGRVWTHRFTEPKPATVIRF